MKRMDAQKKVKRLDIPITNQAVIKSLYAHIQPQKRNKPIEENPHIHYAQPEMPHSDGFVACATKTVYLRDISALSKEEIAGLSDDDEDIDETPFARVHIEDPIVLPRDRELICVPDSILDILTSAMN